MMENQFSLSDFVLENYFDFQFGRHFTWFGFSAKTMNIWICVDSILHTIKLARLGFRSCGIHYWVKLQLSPDMNKYVTLKHPYWGIQIIIHICASCQFSFQPFCFLQLQFPAPALLSLNFSLLQKISLADMETALVRNLTDHMGNNLLHIVCRQVSITDHFSLLSIYCYDCYCYCYDIMIVEQGHTTLLAWLASRLGGELEQVMVATY